VRLVFWLLVAVGAVYAFYSGAMVIWSHLEVQSIVETAVLERGRGSQQERANSVKEEILKRAAESGIGLTERDTSITDDGAALTVRVRWSWPVVRYGGEVVLAIPLSHERTFEPRPPR